MKRRFVCAACFCLCMGVFGCGGDDAKQEQKPVENVPENTEALCSDGFDNDNNGKTDCEEEDCQWFEVCAVKVVAENTEELCTDGLDNDNNGKKDCEEEDCQWFDACMQGVKAENTEALCSDGEDNDGNGKADCEEESCQQMRVCEKKAAENTPELCSDGRDNDNNGDADRIERKDDRGDGALHFPIIIRMLKLQSLLLGVIVDRFLDLLIGNAILRGYIVLICTDNVSRKNILCAINSHIDGAAHALQSLVDASDEILCLFSCILDLQHVADSDAKIICNARGDQNFIVLLRVSALEKIGKPRVV